MVPPPLVGEGVRGRGSSPITRQRRISMRDFWSIAAAALAGLVGAAAMVTALLATGLPLPLVWETVFSAANRAGVAVSVASLAAGYLVYAAVAMGLFAALRRPQPASPAAAPDGERRRALTTLGALL